MKSKRNHPIYIIKEMFIIIKQMILPLLILIFANLKDGAGAVLWAGGGLFLFFLVYAFMAWKNTCYSISDDVLFFEKGVLSKSKQSIGIDKITTVNENQGLLEQVFRLVTLKIDAGSATRGNEVKLTISKKNAEDLILNLRVDKTSDTEENQDDQVIRVGREHQIGLKELILYAITSNSFFAGIIFVLTAWQFGQDIPIVRNFMDGPFADWINQYSMSTVRGLSVSSIFMIVIIGLLVYTVFSFVVSVIIAIIKYYGFTVSRQGDVIKISFGLIEKKNYSLPVSKITALYVQYGFIGQFCGMCHLKIESVGYGDEKGEEAILYPILNDNKRTQIINELIPEYAFADPVVKPPKRALKSFLARNITIPVILATILSFVVPYGVFSWFIVLIFGALGISNYRKTGIAREAGQIVIAGGGAGKWFAVVKGSYMQAITTKQSFFQKRSGLVHLNYSFQSNRFGSCVEAKFLNAKDVTGMTALEFFDK